MQRFLVDPDSDNRRATPAKAASALAAACLMAAALPAAAEEAGAAEAAEATLPAAPSPSAASTTTFDPWMDLNRPVFDLSMGLDRYIFAPLVHGYMAITPAVVRSRISSMVDNLGEPGTAINDVAQGHPKRAGKASVRFVINSTVGVLGMFDVADGLDLPFHESDFGQTLGRYGAKPGPYIYLPFIGPSNVRDGVGLVVDAVTDPVSLLGGRIDTTFGATRFAVTALDTRVRGDPAIRALEDATDPYATVRSAYTQNREFMVRSATGEVDDLPDFDAVPEAPAPKPSAN